MCNDDEVKAAGPAAAPSEEKLPAFVRYASMVVATKCCLGHSEFESSSRRRHGSTYGFVMDSVDNTYRPVRVGIDCQLVGAFGWASE